MAKLKLSGEIPLPPDQAWAKLSDLSQLDKWMALHEAWRGAVPESLSVGTQLGGVVKAKGMRNRVTWTVKTLDPPHKMVLSGAGKGGTKFGFELGVARSAAGSTLTLEFELGGWPLMGPIGAGLALAVKGDLERSLERFKTLYA
jgi:uncharacterized protein YndB with AHSA1/START domain